MLPCLRLLSYKMAACRARWTLESGKGLSRISDGTQTSKVSHHLQDTSQALVPARKLWIDPIQTSGWKKSSFMTQDDMQYSRKTNNFLPTESDSA